MRYIEKDPLQTKIEFLNLVVLVTLIFVGAFAVSAKFALGVLVGGVICIANFHWLCLGLKKVIVAPTVSRGKRSAILRFYVRFGITAVALYFIVTTGVVDIFGVLIGLSVIMVNLVLITIWFLLKKTA